MKPIPANYAKEEESKFSFFEENLFLSAKKNLPSTHHIIVNYT